MRSEPNLRRSSNRRRQLEESLTLVSNPQSIQPAIDELAQSVLARNSLMVSATIRCRCRHAGLLCRLSRSRSVPNRSQSTSNLLFNKQNKKSSAQRSPGRDTTSIDDAWPKSQSRWQQVVDDRSLQLDAARLRPLSAEQFCWSICG